MADRLLTVRIVAVLAASLVSGLVQSAKGAAPTTAESKPELSGIWLVEAAANFMPRSLIRSKLTLTDHSFSLTGYYGVTNPWTGTYTLAANGDPRNLDLKTDIFDMSQYNPMMQMSATEVRGIYKVDPSPDGDRLTICIGKHSTTPRPTIFKDTETQQLATFVRVGADFKDFPSTVTVTVLDPDGKPAAGARIFTAIQRVHAGEHPFSPDSGPLTWNYGDCAKTGADGTAQLPYKDFEEWIVPAGAHDPEHHWTGFAPVTPGILRHGTLTIRMQPERTVLGKLTCNALTREGKKIPKRYAYLYVYGNQTIWCLSEDGALEFHLPPGNYHLQAYGDLLRNFLAEINIPPGTEDYKLPPIDLEPSRMLLLTGGPPPPLDDIRAWKNGPAKLADYKGKVVLLDFWGYWCGPCVEVMPKLTRIDEKYKDRGLAVVSLHIDNDGEIDTVAKLDAKIASERKAGIWKAADLPFPTGLLSGPASENALIAKYGILGFPTTLVIDRDGNLLGEMGDQMHCDLRDDEKTIDAAIEKCLARKEK